MATATTLFGASTSALAVTALHSRTDGQYWKSASINFSSNSPLWVEIQVKLVSLNSGAGSASGYADVFLARSSDNTTFEANISAGDAQWTSTNPTLAEYSKSLYYLGRIAMGTTETASYTWVKSFIVPFGEVPKYGVVVIQNASGKSLAASGSAVTYLENKVSVA